MPRWIHGSSRAGRRKCRPVLRSETRVVLVDAVAVDKKGKFTQDLTEKDFKNWEDGKEQKISRFSHESSGVSPERPSKHYIAMFFDTSTAGQGGMISVRQEAVRFVDGFASPDRYMAVINYNFDGGLRIAQNFTTDRDQLKKALSLIQSSSNSTPTVASAPPAPRARRQRRSEPQQLPRRRIRSRTATCSRHCAAL